MSVRLCVGDVVLVKPIKDHQCIGLIKYVGPMANHDMMSEYVGIELLDSIPKGHNGTIDGFTYFTTSKGYGCHTKTNNIIKKLLSKDLFKEMKQLYNVFQHKLQHISKLESLLNTARKRSSTPEKINTNLPYHDASPAHGHGRQSNSKNSVQSTFSQVTNAYSLASPIPTHSYHSYNIARKLNLQNTNSKLSNIANQGRSSTTSSYSATISSDDSNSDSSYSSDSEKEKKPRKKRKNKKRKKKSSSTSKECVRIVRKRSNTTGHKHKTINSQNVLISQHVPNSPYTNRNMNISHIYNNQYQTMRLPPAIPRISESKSSPLLLPHHQTAQSAPASPYISYLEQHQHQQHQSSLTNMSLAQSNTQVIDDVDIYTNTPFSVSPMSQNMLMVSNAYSASPYGHYYNDSSVSHSHISPTSHTSLGFIQTTPTTNYNFNDVSNHSTPIMSRSPYSARLAAFNEYRQRNNMIQQSPIPMHSQPGLVASHSAGKMYQMQKNGHEIRYQHK